jgi:flavin reductase (DIM6/NTAB) family NADH-FMN oxidoreductase RutF
VAIATLKTAWSLLRNGRGLRHSPVVAPAESGVRVLLHGTGAAAPLDVSADHVPVSLRPLVLGMRLDAAPAASSRLTLSFHDAGDGAEFGRLDAEATGSLPMSRGALWLLKPVRCRNRCAPAPARWAQYAFAWRHARLAPARGDRLAMTAGDLRSLNLYYAVRRPVYLVGVASEGRTNLFPMDLVGRLSSGEFLLALRATSPAIELMERSGVIALSIAPADQLQAVYALGAHHKRETVDVGALPFPVQPSPRFGLPSLAGRLAYELAVEQVHRIGSHVLFVTRIEAHDDLRDNQLAHVSTWYVDWAARRGRQIVAAR